MRTSLRFTVRSAQRAFVHPATHYASSSTDPTLPPMGLRVRLKASFDVSAFTGASRAVLVALKRVPANAFEVVQTGSIVR